MVIYARLAIAPGTYLLNSIVKLSSVTGISHTDDLHVNLQD
jgi:hypothetical protein